MPLTSSVHADLSVDSRELAFLVAAGNASDERLAAHYREVREIRDLDLGPSLRANVEALTEQIVADVRLRVAELEGESPRRRHIRRRVERSRQTCGTKPRRRDSATVVEKVKARRLTRQRHPAAPSRPVKGSAVQSRRERRPGGSRRSGSRRSTSSSARSSGDSGDGSGPGSAEPPPRRKASCTHCSAPTYSTVEFEGREAHLCDRCGERLVEGQSPVLGSLRRASERSVS